MHAPKVTHDDDATPTCCVALLPDATGSTFATMSATGEMCTVGATASTSAGKAGKKVKKVTKTMSRRDLAGGTPVKMIVHPDGKSALVLNDEGAISRRCRTTGDVLATYTPRDNRFGSDALMAEPDDCSTVYTVDGDRVVALSGDALSPTPFTGSAANEGPARCISVSACKEYVVTGHDSQRAVVWSIEGACRHCVINNGHPSAPGGAITGARISPDGSILTLGDDAGSLGLYDLKQQEFLYRLEPAEALGTSGAAKHVLYSPTRYWVACAVGGGICVVDLESKQTIFAQFGGGGHSPVSSMAFSHHGLSVMAVREDGSRTLVDLNP